MPNQNSGQQAIIQGLQVFQQAQALHAARRYAEAAAAYNRALALLPNHPKVLVEFARLADEVKDWKVAEKLYRHLGKIRPQSNFEGLLGHALFRQDRFADAVPWLHAHIDRHPTDAEVMHALGNSLCSIGQWEQGLEKLRAAHALSPDDIRLDAVMNALFHLARTDELDQLMAPALARFPDSQAVRSMVALHQLKSGNYEAGFRYFADFRWRNNLNVPEHVGIAAPPWDGKVFDGILLVAAEQGLGDEIMMSSMLDALVACGQRALVECDARLLPVFTRSFPALSFVPRHQKKLPQAISDQPGTTFRRIHALDLCRLFRSAPDSFPDRHHWLLPDPARRDALRAQYRLRWPGRKLVGISWKSTRILEGGDGKSLLLEDFRPLLQRDDCVFLSLQYGNVQADIDQLNALVPDALHTDPGIDASQDIDGLCAQIAALDGVVSISNTTVHIAGAVGTPALVLLPRVRPILWYWGYRGEHTRWYPSLQLLRNNSDDSCDDLMQRANNLLPELLAGVPS